MERLIVVWCPGLLAEGERGEEVHRFLGVLQVVERFCPWVDPVRLGVCALPARGPSRLFGGDAAVVAQLSAALAELLGTPEAASVGAADGLFAGMLAARSQVVVPKAGTAEFLGPWSVSVLRRPELAVTLQRLGIHTLAQFAALPTPDVLARFGADGASCHRVARAEQGDLPGLRDPRLDRRLREARGEAAGDEDRTPRQPDFFGGASAADTRAARAFSRVQQRLGTGAVVVGRLRGGRGPGDQAALVPWGSRESRDQSAGGARPPAPWPGRIPVPSPVTVLASPVSAELVDGTGAPVLMSARGLLSAPPAHISVHQGPWEEVTGWAGPWPMAERWWSGRRRRGRLQVVTGSGTAALLVTERDRWWLEAVYD